MITSTSPSIKNERNYSQPRLYTVPETAELLRISTWNVHKLIREHDLGSLKVGVRRLIPAEDINSFIEERRTGRARRGFHG
jgi:excisionase family DNA binding protein